MPAFTQTHFYGMAPRSGFRVRKPGYAELALDVDLQHGDIRPIRTNLLVSTETGRSLYKHDCCFLTFGNCVSVADAGCNNRLFITGDNSYPESATVNADCSLTRTRLGMPCLFDAPIAQVASATDIGTNHSARSYIYVYRNSYGELSGPSFPSDIVYAKDGEAVIVNGFLSQAVDYGIVSILIYRVETGNDLGNEAQNTPNSVPLFVAEIPVAQGSYIDTVKAIDLGDGIETEDFQPPPAGLQGIGRVKDYNLLFGFAGNQVHFSEINHVHNWPDDNVITLDDEVKAITEVDGTIYVSTKGAPYSISVNVGQDGARDVFKHKVAHRHIGDSKAFTTIPNGMVYVSEVGLILLSGKSVPSIITDGYFAATDWQQLQPHSMRLQYWNGNIYFFSYAKSFRMDVPRTGDSGWEADGLIQLTDKASDTFVDERNQMFLLNDNGIEHFQNGVDYRQYRYLSTVIHLQGNISFTSGKIFQSGGATIELFNELRSRFKRFVGRNRPFRIPRQGKWIDLQYELTGIGTVSAIEFGGSHHEIASV